jgi:hypothetical protein
MGGRQNSLGVVVRKPERKRQLGRLSRRLEVDIKTQLTEAGRGDMNLIHLAQNMAQWRGLVNAVMNFRVHKMWDAKRLVPSLSCVRRIQSISPSHSNFDVVAYLPTVRTVKPAKTRCYTTTVKRRSTSLSKEPLLGRRTYTATERMCFLWVRVT